MENNKSKNTKLIILVIGLVIIAAAVMGYFAIPQLSASALDAQSVQQIFIDIDGDGALDLLVRGEVVFNIPFEPAKIP